MPVPAPSRRAFLHGCAAGLSLALIRPALAQDAEAPPPLGFRELADGVWLHTSWRKADQGWIASNGLAVIGPEEVLLIDAAWTSGADRGAAGAGGGGRAEPAGQPGGDACA